MGERRSLTRRALLGGMAAAGAASVVRPVAGVAQALDRAVLDPAGGVSSLWLGSLRGSSRPIAAPRRFALAGVEWAGPRDARIELRALAAGRSWTHWGLASSTGHDPDHHTDGLFGEPLWTGPADQVQLR